MLKHTPSRAPTHCDPFDSCACNEDETFHVPVNKWHQIINTFDEDCHIIEIQYGKRTVENDIERSSISGID